MIRARSSIFSRLVILAIALSVALVVSLWFLTDQTIRDTMRASAERAVDVDIAGLVDIYATGGRGELEQRISDRLALTPMDGNSPHYLLADGAGNRLAGDIAIWPKLDPAVSESGAITVGQDTPAFARATLLGPDLQLLVARETGGNGPLLRRVGAVFLVGGALFVILVGALGRSAAGRLQRRIGRLNEAFRDPDAGRVAQLALGPASDEIDELTSHSVDALARQKRLVEAYRDMSDQVAHEIRTPLMHLDSRLVKALAAGPEPEIGERLVEARGDLRRLVDTLESLLDIASSKARQGDRAGLKPVDLSAMVTGICELYADSAEESGHAFGWEVAPGVIFEAEEAQFGRLVTNLLDNAFKYVPAGGMVELRLERGPVLTVCDDGPGIPPEEREKVFERFYRSRATQDGAPGSGLGLALARAIAERHGLTLRVIDSERGASFRVEGGC